MPFSSYAFYLFCSLNFFDIKATRLPLKKSVAYFSVLAQISVHCESKKNAFRNVVITSCSKKFSNTFGLQQLGGSLACVLASCFCVAAAFLCPISAPFLLLYLGFSVSFRSYFALLFFAYFPFLPFGRIHSSSASSASSWSGCRCPWANNFTDKRFSTHLMLAVCAFAICLLLDSENGKYII